MKGEGADYLKNDGVFLPLMKSPRSRFPYVLSLRYPPPQEKVRRSITVAIQQLVITQFHTFRLVLKFNNFCPLLYGNSLDIFFMELASMVSKSSWSLQQEMNKVSNYCFLSNMKQNTIKVVYFLGQRILFSIQLKKNQYFSLKKKSVQIKKTIKAKIFKRGLNLKPPTLAPSAISLQFQTIYTLVVSTGGEPPARPSRRLFQEQNNDRVVDDKLLIIVNMHD